MNPASLRILILTQYYPPETGAPQSRLSELARRLRDAGHQVQVLTAMPNYPVGKVFPEYRGRWTVREEREGIGIVRTAIYPSRSASLLPRLANYFSFALSAALVGLFKVRRPDVIVVESPPLFLGLSAIFLRMVFRARLVMNVSDLWPESAVFMGVVRNRAIIAATTWLERTLYRWSDACTGQSRGIVRGIRRAAPSARAYLIPNGADCQRFGPQRRSDEFRRRIGAGDRVLVGYAGLLGLAQGVELLLRVATRLNRDDIHFVIVGDGPEREEIARAAAERKLGRFTLYGHVPKDQMPGIVAAFDLTIIPLRHSIPGALPSKMYEAMASSVPIVLAAEGDSAELLRAADCGIATRYEDEDAIVTAVARLADDPVRRRQLGANGRAFVQAHHDLPVIAARMERVLAAAARRKLHELEPESV